MTKPLILIIDDEAQIRKLLEITLESNDYSVAQAENGKLGIQLAANLQPNVILLDLGLPDLDGQNVLQQLRLWFESPIIVLSVLHDEKNIVQALDHGANDFIAKPFRTAELLARIRAVLRTKNKDESVPMVSSDDLCIDFAARLVTLDKNTIKLTNTEFNLLALLARHEGKVLSHKFILKEIWGPGQQAETQYLRVFIGNLRKKIEKDPTKPVHLITESGVGYRFL